MALPTITERPVKEVVNTGDAYYCFISRWNALHNPVVYQILNDKWPVNSLDAAQVITGQADDNGNVQFTIAGHPFTALEWVTIAGSSVTSYNGTWQIIDEAANTITLDLSYEAGAIGGAITATLYYQNYHSLIQVWAGVPAGHILNAEDPIALVATIKAEPDDVNLSKVDVSTLARDHVNLLNDLGLIDNDTNLWTGIYIKFAESYDSSDGTDVTQFISNYTDDVAELVYGVQSKMPFQNEYGGNMAAYVLDDCKAGLFLTKFLDPVLWINFYYDLGYIVTPEFSDLITLQYSEYDSNQNLLTSGNTINIIDLDEGIYRTQLNTLTFTAGTSYIIIYVVTSGTYIIMEDDFAGVIVNTFKWTEVDLRPSDMRLGQNDELVFDKLGNSSPESRLEHYVQSILTINNGSAQCTFSNVDSQEIQVVLSLWDGTITNQILLLSAAADKTKIRVLISLGGVDQYDFTSVIDINNSVKIQRDGDNISFWYWSGAWTQIGATQNIPGFPTTLYGAIFCGCISSVNADVANADDFYLTNGNYVTQVPAASGSPIISEAQKIIINSECENQSIYLTWLNNLGGWEYWNFTAQKEYGVNIEDSSEFDKNIFEDWDDNFINGETVTALEQVVARNTREVRSQFVTETQIDAIREIKTSIRVQQIRGDGTKITVLVDKGSFKIKEDRQKLYTIDFSIRYTDLIPVQDA